jgi:hypothetical protein
MEAFMAITVTVDNTLSATLEKIARSKVQHPTALTRELISAPVLFTFSMGLDGNTPTVVLSSDGTNLWAFEAEPTLTFDDRSLA